MRRRLLRGIQQEEFVGRQEAFGLDDGDHGLIDGGEAAVPVALVVAEGLGQRLEARHGGHFLDAVDEKSGARAAQDENESGGRRRQTEMQGAVDDVERVFAALHDVANFAKTGACGFRWAAPARVSTLRTS